MLNLVRMMRWAIVVEAKSQVIVESMSGRDELLYYNVTYLVEGHILLIYRVMQSNRMPLKRWPPLTSVTGFVRMLRSYFLGSFSLISFY